MRKVPSLATFLRIAAVIALMAIFGTVLLQIAGRHFLPTAPAWTEEMGRLLLIWLTAIGAGLALRHDGYRGAFEALLNGISPAHRHAINLMFMALSVAFLVVLVYYAYAAVERNTSVITSALKAPVSYFYLGLVALGLLLLWGMAHTMASELRALIAAYRVTASRGRDNGGK